MSPQRPRKALAIHRVRTEVESPSPSAGGGSAGIVDLLAAALKREGDWRTSHGFRLGGHYVPIAERLLADAELLDALVAYRQKSGTPVPLAEWQVYHHPSGDAADILITKRVRNYGVANIVFPPIPLPVVGRVWLARTELPGSGEVEILCTAEGLAARGFTLTDITEESGG